MAEIVLDQAHEKGEIRMCRAASAPSDASSTDEVTSKRQASTVGTSREMKAYVKSLRRSKITSAPSSKRLARFATSYMARMGQAQRVARKCPCLARQWWRALEPYWTNLFPQPQTHCASTATLAMSRCCFSARRLRLWTKIMTIIARLWPWSVPSAQLQRCDRVTKIHLRDAIKKVIKRVSTSDMLFGHRQRRTSWHSWIPEGDEKHSQLIELLLGIDEWNFDIFALLDLYNGDREKTTITVASQIFVESTHLVKKLGISYDTFRTWATRITEGYNDVPYHNCLHGADVLQAMHSLRREAP